MYMFTTANGQLNLQGCDTANDPPPPLPPGVPRESRAGGFVGTESANKGYKVWSTRCGEKLSAVVFQHLLKGVFEYSVQVKRQRLS